MHRIKDMLMRYLQELDLHISYRQMDSIQGSILLELVWSRAHRHMLNIHSGFLRHLVLEAFTAHIRESESEYSPSDHMNISVLPCPCTRSKAQAWPL